MTWVIVKCNLNKYVYTPALRDLAVQTVIQQDEFLCAEVV